ncbi:hypothetical protein V6N12_066268 [Hibiscus sabdariffa]|uniref:Uncharacterized protein n=1 Tax=Hibiscus sabdariffa TaxID=183260 RepID=A0ABR1ZLR1_9ROSI
MGRSEFRRGKFDSPSGSSEHRGWLVQVSVARVKSFSSFARREREKRQCEVGNGGSYPLFSTDPLGSWVMWFDPPM